MKRVVFILTALSVMLTFFSCNASDTAKERRETAQITDRVQQEEEGNDIPEEPEKKELTFPMEFYFSSGAGAWYTLLTLEEDDLFRGEYHNADGNTVYLSTFYGGYSLERINDYSYRLVFEHFDYLDSIGSSWQEGPTTYIASEAAGFELRGEFILYTPDTPIELLSEEFLYWHRSGDELSGELGCFAVHNTADDSGFFAY